MTTNLHLLHKRRSKQPSAALFLLCFAEFLEQINCTGCLLPINQRQWLFSNYVLIHGSQFSVASGNWRGQLESGEWRYDEVSSHLSLNWYRWALQRWQMRDARMNGSPQLRPLIQHRFLSQPQTDSHCVLRLPGPSLHFFMRPFSHLWPEDLEHELEVTAPVAVSFWNWPVPQIHIPLHDVPFSIIRNTRAQRSSEKPSPPQRTYAKWRESRSVMSDSLRSHGL